MVNLSAAEFDQMLMYDKDTKDRNGISDAIMISLNRKHELFRQYKNGIVTFDHFKNNFTLLYVLQKIAVSRENSQSALKTLGTRGRL